MWTTQIAFYNVTTHRDLNFNSQKQFWTLHCNIINHGEFKKIVSESLSQ